MILQQNLIDHLPLESPQSESSDPSFADHLRDNGQQVISDLGLVDEFAQMETATLTSDQENAFNKIFAAKGLHLLSGTPGAGKTFLTQYLVTHMWRRAGKRVLLTATTGCAAVRLSSSARTLHGTFHFPHDNRPLPPLKPTDPMYEAILAADVIIIDEMSMLTAFLLCLVMYRLGQLFGWPHAALGNELILLVGDHAQLPPVCSGHHGSSGQASVSSAQKDLICLQCHISSSIWWPQSVSSSNHES
jgi:hypothetical protein